MLDPETKLLQNGTRSSDHIGHGSDSTTFDSSHARTYGSRARKAAQNYKKYNSWNGMEVRFAPEVKAIDDSDICSPPLWTTSPPESPQRRADQYRSMSPKSRTEAIARGQKELMEMVRNMPESCYELTLKDLVEQPLVEPPRESVSEVRDPSNEVLYRRESSKKMTDKRALVRRSTSDINGGGGLYLKMGFPIYLGSRKNNKKNESGTNANAKVSPKPPVPDGSAKVVDKEWWKKRFSVSGESESGGSISNSGSLKSSGSSSSSSGSRSRSSSGRSRSRSNSRFVMISRNLNIN